MPTKNTLYINCWSLSPDHLSVDVMKAGSTAAICSRTKIGSELNPPHCLLHLQLSFSKHSSESRAQPPLPARLSLLDRAWREHRGWEQGQRGSREPWDSLASAYGPLQGQPHCRAAACKHSWACGHGISKSSVFTHLWKQQWKFR